ncbi:hypothetical protein ACFOMD_10725 [Sphingoaurantiacus capsulatus]|uniref:Uncharacterized protein n=1 Tax=Sphingoaurantiacus capsulatus TaxID=1771310 RepID=A0ABV7XCR6_9SPHN
MRFALPALAGAALLALAPVNAAPEPAAAQMAKALEGRTAGEPVKCLNLRDIRSTQIIKGTAILYETNGGVIYVNTPRGGAQSLDKWDVLVTNTHSSQLCSIDVVRLYDTSSRIQTGFVNLGEFVPYRKAKS